MRALFSIGILLGAVVVAVHADVVPIVSVMLIAGIAVMPERHALPPRDRCHALQRNRKGKQRDSKNTEESSRHQ